MRWLYRPNFSLKNNSKVLFINFPTLNQKEISKSYEKIKIRKKSSFLIFVLLKTVLPKRTSFRSDTEKWWIIKSVSFILKKEESFITNCIAFPGLRKNIFTLPFSLQLLKISPPNTETRHSYLKERSPLILSPGMERS